MSSRHGWIILAGLVTLPVSGTLPADTAQKPPALEEALVKARVDGKYQMLLRQFKAPDDEKEHGAFKDLGPQARSEYRGQTNLPSGHWVYVAPYWYIWRDAETGAPRPKRAWGPEQMVGAPDSWPRSGDIQTAWASLTQDGEDEWLLLEYAEPVQPSALLIYETYNPGAVIRVLVYRLDGEEVEVWKGTDPTPIGSGKGVSVIPFRVNFKTNRVKIELKSKDVSGWNEIDAVGLRAGGKTHWVSAAHTSTTYASLVMTPPPPPPPVPQFDERKLRMLEKDVRDLKLRLKQIEERIKKRNMK